MTGEPVVRIRSGAVRGRAAQGGATFKGIPSPNFDRPGSWQPALQRADVKSHEGWSKNSEASRSLSIDLAWWPGDEAILRQHVYCWRRSLPSFERPVVGEVGDKEGMAEALSMLGKVEAARGDHAFARTLYEDSLATAREIGDRELLASGLEGVASVVAVQGDLAWATRLWGTAEALREAIGAPLPPIERTV